jgi:hypothetical protein
MSNKAQTKCLLARNAYAGELLLPSNAALTFGHHDQLLEVNLRTVMQKYPHLSEQKVRDLLEELDNNCQLAVQILDEEEKSCRQIMEEKVVVESKKTPPMSKAEENRILKQSFLNLYKKFLAKAQELEQLSGKYESARQENGKLREMNRLLLQGEYGQQCLQDLTPIC